MSTEALNKQLLADKEQQQLDKIAVDRQVEFAKLCRRLGIRTVRATLPELRTRKPLPGQMELF